MQMTPDLSNLPAILFAPTSAKVKEAPEDSGTAGIARESYDASLSKYHPWLIRKGANMAMYLLPSRKTLVNSMCKTSLEEAVSFS